ncbi:hypothetical protein GQ457_04G029900 [Hibiscus cannabinus]
MDLRGKATGLSSLNFPCKLATFFEVCNVSDFNFNPSRRTPFLSFLPCNPFKRFPEKKIVRISDQRRLVLAVDDI